MTEMLGSMPKANLLRLAAIALALLAAGASPAAGADELLDGAIATLWGQGLGEKPATPILLLWEMALDESRAAEILDRADPGSRALTDTLLSTLSLSEPLARRQIPQLHVVRDQDPAGIDRAPTWRDLRRVGLELLERIAPYPDHARDRRLQSELIAARARIRRWTPSEVGGLVVLWENWWIDRGDHAEFYLVPAHLPNVDGWLAAYADPRSQNLEQTLWQLAGSLHDDALRARLFVERIDPQRHAFLAAECMEILGSYPADFERRGLPESTWDPGSGRLVGYRASALREIALELLQACTGFFPSGVSEHERVRSCFRWWRRAQLEARYYRDPRSAPDLEEFLAGWDRPEAEGGNSMARVLRRLFMQPETRSVVFDRLGPPQAAMTAELIEWLSLDFKQASERGFAFTYHLEPIRPVPSQTGPRATIPLSEIRGIARAMLVRVSQYELPFEGLPAEEQDALWRRWWEGVRRDPRWHRGEVPEYQDAPSLFRPERGRAGGR